MQNFFSPENKIFFRLTQLADLIFLSVLWILCCLTIVLAVPASAAMYHAAYKVIRREHGSLLREFWDNLKKNCKQGIGMTQAPLIFRLTPLRKKPSSGSKRMVR